MSRRIAAPTVSDWRELATCREVDPELFHPEVERGRAYEEQVASAKRVCAVCPVQAECLAFALVMWISTVEERCEQGIQVGDMSATSLVVAAGCPAQLRSRRISP
ncbi:MAG: WhiB family transcriptional regulator, partial [Dehalococcoidia bacterium]